VAILLVLSAGAGAILNGLRRDGLPYDLPASVLTNESGVRAVFIGEARRLFDEADYVFVDARREEDYRAGHIEGALSLPAAQFDALYPELQVWAAGQPLLVYGSAFGPLIAEDLARHLRERGEKEVLLFAPGYEGWLARGYPTATGDDGVLQPEGP
jgi:rhodanese-related sulfurtransferase